MMRETWSAVVQSLRRVSKLDSRILVNWLRPAVSCAADASNAPVSLSAFSWPFPAPTFGCLSLPLQHPRGARLVQSRGRREKSAIPTAHTPASCQYWPRVHYSGPVACVLRQRDRRHRALALRYGAGGWGSSCSVEYQECRGRRLVPQVDRSARALPRQAHLAIVVAVLERTSSLTRQREAGECVELVFKALSLYWKSPCVCLGVA